MPRKIIYFDRETIKNMLQERNRGTKIKTTGVEGEANVAVTAKAEASSSIYLGVPFFARVKFLITGTLQSQFLLKYDSSTTITSTEISDFESIQKDFVEFKDKQVFDIENSSTFFRVAGGYLKMMGNKVEGVDVREFKAVMDSFEGYDVYKIDKEKYIRFNNAAFVSNYKRNDLLTTKITAYCVPVGKFVSDDFNFLIQINKMQHLVTNANSGQTLAEAFPEGRPCDVRGLPKSDKIENGQPVTLYDVVYACIAEERMV